MRWPCNACHHGTRGPATALKPGSAEDKSTPATPIWENPNSRAHARIFHQTRTVDLTAAERHPPIVETAADPGAGLAHRGRHAAFAQRWPARPPLRNAFIELHGDLGAGKTTLVRHLLRALGVQGRIKSPTYAVVEPHEAPGLAIWHFDFYRFTDPREWEDAGFRDMFASPGLKLAEWPKRPRRAARGRPGDPHGSQADDARTADADGPHRHRPQPAARRNA
jgi:tRNA threonylcarbamoyladenosine biosynthesis protein TsaE